MNFAQRIDLVRDPGCPGADFGRFFLAPGAGIQVARDARLFGAVQLLVCVGSQMSVGGVFLGPEIHPVLLSSAW